MTLLAASRGECTTVICTKNKDIPLISRVAVIQNAMRAQELQDKVGVGRKLSLTGELRAAQGGRGKGLGAAAEMQRSNKSHDRGGTTRFPTTLSPEGGGVWETPRFASMRGKKGG